jgi:glycosyltransferase involved in cell wall biosynthesis
MNIGVDLRCLQSSPRTGVGEYTFELLSAILEQDRTNRYFLFFNASGKIDIPDFKGPNVTIARFYFPNKLLSLSSLVFKYPKLDKLIAKKFGIEKIDLFYSPHLNFTSLSKSVKHIITIHDLTFELLPQFLTQKQRLWHLLTNAREQCQRAHAILTPSENTKRDVLEFYKIPEAKAKVVYPGLSPRYLEGNSQQPKKKIVLFLGTIEPRKNILNIIKAFRDIEDRIKEYTLVVAGAPGWKNKEAFDLINDPSVSNRIKYIGYVRDEDKANLFLSASVFVYPSFYEGFGFPVIEAMASGTPVITSNRSSLAEITEGAALLVNPNRTSDISNAILRLINDQTLQAELVSKGLEQARKYTWEKAAKSWLDIIK